MGRADQGQRCHGRVRRSALLPRRACRRSCNVRSSVVRAEDERSSSYCRHCAIFREAWQHRQDVMTRTSPAAIAATISSLLFIANTVVATAEQIKILSGSPIETAIAVLIPQFE